jgi:16S rRNA (guanine527-N7)-methyltransferase
MCTSSQKIALEAHFELMLRWNAKLNLTRITDREQAWERHYKESIFLAHKLPAGPLRIADVGSGAGFPGIPIAVVRPECSVTLIESHQRKAVFLREATRDLPNVRVLAMRAEDVGEKFDWIVSRAVSPEEVLKLDLALNVALLTGHFEVSVPRGTL